MKKFSENRTMICNLICTVLMVILLVLQFMPFWSYGDQSNSIQGYIWFPTECDELEDYFVENVGSDYSVNDVVVMPITTLFATVGTVVLFVFFKERIFTAIVPAICGVVGIYGYLSKPIYQLGAGWGFHVVLCVAITVAAVLAMVNGLLTYKKSK